MKAVCSCCYIAVVLVDCDRSPRIDGAVSSGATTQSSHSSLPEVVRSGPTVGQFDAPPDALDELNRIPVFDASGLTREKAIVFLDRLKSVVAESDSRAMANLVSYPISVWIGGARVEIATPEKFAREYDAIMNAKVRNAVTEQRTDGLGANSGGIMVGRGEIWFRCPDHALTTNKDGRFSCDGADIRVVAINNR